MAIRFVAGSDLESPGSRAMTRLFPGESSAVISIVRLDEIATIGCLSLIPARGAGRIGRRSTATCSRIGPAASFLGGTTTALIRNVNEDGWPKSGPWVNT